MLMGSSKNSTASSFANLTPDLKYRVSGTRNFKLKILKLKLKTRNLKL